MTDASQPRVPPDGGAGSGSKRRPPRVAGPFEARSVGALELPLRIHDISLSGCLIESYHELSIGRRFQLEIELPVEGWISLHAETVNLRKDFGFAVKFVAMDEQTRVKLARTVLQLLRERKRAR